MRDVLPCAVPYNHIFEANRALDIVIGRVFLFFFGSMNLSVECIVVKMNHGHLRVCCAAVFSNF